MNIYNKNINQRRYALASGKYISILN